jgi:hypothetical protein
VGINHIPRSYEAFGSDPRDDSWAIYGRWE